MTLNEKKPDLLIGFDEDLCREIWVELDDNNLVLLAEFISNRSTIRNRDDFISYWPGFDDMIKSTVRPDDDYDYNHIIDADYNRVRDFADTHNLEYDIIQL